MTVRRFVFAGLWLWSGVMFLAPFILLLKISFAQMQLGIPPYTALLERTEDGLVAIRATLESYRLIVSDALYVKAYLSSLKTAAISTVLALLIGYPMAYGMARSAPKMRGLLLFLVILPFWTSFLVRIYAWIGLLRPSGVINEALQVLGVIDEPLRMLNTDGAVYLGIVYAYLPFMVLPLYARLEKLDATLLEAAADLGASPWRAFLGITLPLSVPGIIAGSLLVFVPAVGEYVIPELLGGPDTLMIGRVVWNEFFTNRDWPLTAALTVILLALLVTPVVWLQRLQTRGEVIP